MMGHFDTYECEATAGSAVAYCSPELSCRNDVECAPVTGRCCTALCDSVPPSCPSGQLAEPDGSC
jgi:hypothetical protein